MGGENWSVIGQAMHQHGGEWKQYVQGIAAEECVCVAGGGCGYVCELQPAGTVASWDKHC